MDTELKSFLHFMWTCVYMFIHVCGVVHVCEFSECVEGRGQRWVSSSISLNIFEVGSLLPPGAVRLPRNLSRLSLYSVGSRPTLPHPAFYTWLLGIRLGCQRLNGKQVTESHLPCHSKLFPCKILRKPCGLWFMGDKIRAKVVEGLVHLGIAVKSS